MSDFGDLVPTDHVLNMQSAGEGEDGGDPSLDFTSSSFDALKALHTDPSKLQLPYSSVQPADNLDAYESSKGGREVSCGCAVNPIKINRGDY